MMKKRRSRNSVPKGPGSSRGLRNIRWIEKHLRIPEGAFVGQPVKLRPWQKRIIKEIYDTPTRRAIISFGRKNAKTTLSAFLLLLHLCGPEARANSQLYSGAQSRDQAGIIFALAAKMIRMSPDISAYVMIRDHAKEFFCPELGTIYRALSAEASTAYGLSPVFIVHDELGQVQGPTSGLYDALETATAAQINPLSIVISTQAPTESDLLSILIDDAEKKNDPRVKLFLFTSDPEADPFAIDTIKQANPAFGDFQNKDEVLAMAETAKRMPSMEASFRNLILNQRVETSNPFITKSVWGLNGSEPELNWDGARVYAGLDLSSSNDLTAFVLVGEMDGIYHVRPVFWLPEEGLKEKAKQDRVPYDIWNKQGYLNTTPGNSIEYEYVGKVIVEFIDDLKIRKIGFDRWNMKHLKPWILKAGFPESRFEEVFVDFGQGFQSMSPALRELESLLLNSKVRHGNHPVLTMCAANSVVKSDEAGGRKLDKKKSHGRIDGMVALAMGISIAASNKEEVRYVTERLIVI